MNDGIILGNKIIEIVLVAMLLAQILKGVFYFVKHKKYSLKQFIETGSMPSSHSATVVSLATAVGLSEGFSSTFFAITAVFALIVMYDAAGVRRAAGEQAELLNKIVHNIKEREGMQLLEKNLKELLGHSPLEVMAGAILGLLVALIMYGV
jgi:hypothetical protein